MTSVIGASILISLLAYFGIAALWVMSNKPKKRESRGEGFSFKELFVDNNGLPTLKAFAARDGKELMYRHYSAQSDRVMILVHGSGWHSQYFLPLARFISGEGLAQVYTPDLRGHDYAGTREDTSIANAVSGQAFYSLCKM